MRGAGLTVIVLLGRKGQRLHDNGCTARRDFFSVPKQFSKGTASTVLEKSC